MESIVNFVPILLIRSCSRHSFTHLFGNFLLNIWYVLGT